MTLSLLSIDALEVVINYVENDDKSNLLLTGNKLLTSKLTQVSTDILVLPYIYDVRDDESEDGSYTKRVTCPEMTSSIYVTNMIHKSPQYGLLPFYYKNTKLAMIHDIHLTRAIDELRQLKHLRVYLKSASPQHFLRTTKTLTSLQLDINIQYNIGELVKHLPQTLRSLSMWFFQAGTVNLTEENLELLPRSLESLSGISVDGGNKAQALPQSLTILCCDDLIHVSPGVLPPKLTDLQADLVDVNVISHLPLTNLNCAIKIGANLALIPTLTKATICTSRSQYANDGWHKPVQFPPSLTDLTIRGSMPACCLVPSTVKHLELEGVYNVFAPSTGVWNFTGDNSMIRIPDSVVRANLYIGNATATTLDVMFRKLAPTVENFTLDVDYCNVGTLEFDLFIKCTTLILPDEIQVITLPSSITCLEAALGANVVLSDTLKRLVTPNILPPCAARYVKLDHLECGGALLLEDPTVISHIPTVILHVTGQMRESLPRLPNVQYRFPSMDDF